MSTKIYYGHRFTKSRLTEYIDFVHDTMFDMVVEQVKSLMSKCKVDEEALKKKMKGFGTYSEENFPRAVEWQKFHNTMEVVKELARKHKRCGGFDLDCGVNLWLYGRFWYAIPICEYWIKDKIKYPEWVQDFSYWNNTDEPEDMTRAQWEERGRIWEKVNCGRGKSDHNARRLYHSVVDFSGNASYVSEVELQFRVFPERLR